jgi:hypothetical protein
MHLKRCALFFGFLLIGCSQGQIDSSANPAAQKYNESHRDNVIRNWQNRISDGPECSQFKERMKVAGERHTSAASASFTSDLMKVKDAAKAANCVHAP